MSTGRWFRRDERWYAEFDGVVVAEAIRSRLDRAHPWEWSLTNAGIERSRWPRKQTGVCPTLAACRQAVSRAFAP